jgi:nucleotide-binding universal stress UspA family protein
MILPKIKKILYVTDLSENARHAYSYAASIANNYGAKVTVLHVIEEFSRYALERISMFLGDEEWGQVRKRNEQEVVDAIKTRLETFCEETSDEFPECPFITEKISVKVGLPSTVIVEEAHKGEYDLVVMGAHGQSTLADTMIGSTARRVLRRCQKPVLAVRMPEKT